MVTERPADAPIKPAEKAGDNHLAAATVSQDLNRPGSTNELFKAAKAGGDPAPVPTASIDHAGITFSAGNHDTKMRGFAIERADSAEPPQPNLLPETAGKAEAILDQKNLDAKAKLSTEQLQQVKDLEHGILSGDALATTAVLKGMRPLPGADNSGLAEKNKATADVLAKDLKEAGITAEFDPKFAHDFFGDKDRGPIGNLHLSDRSTTDFDKYYNGTSTDVTLTASATVAGTSEQRVPATTPGFVTTPNSKMLDQPPKDDEKDFQPSEGLRRLGTVAQTNLGVLRDGASDTEGKTGGPIGPVRFQRFRLLESDPLN